MLKCQHCLHFNIFEQDSDLNLNSIYLGYLGICEQIIFFAQLSEHEKSFITSGPDTNIAAELPKKTNSLKFSILDKEGL